MLVLEVFPDYRMFMFLNTLMEVAARVTDIICITQITFEFWLRECHLSDLIFMDRYPTTEKTFKQM